MSGEDFQFRFQYEHIDSSVVVVTGSSAQCMKYVPRIAWLGKENVDFIRFIAARDFILILMEMREEIKTRRRSPQTVDS